MSLFSLIKGLLPKDKIRSDFNEKYSISLDSFGVNFVVDHATFNCLNQGEASGYQLVQHILLKMLQEKGVAEPLPNGFC
jgi:hypothetical protein